MDTWPLLTAERLALVACGVPAAGLLAAVGLYRRLPLAHRLFSACLAAGSLAGAGLGLLGLLADRPLRIAFAGPHPSLPVTLLLDPLAGLFLLLICGLAAHAAWYGREYALHGDPAPSLLLQDLTVAGLIAAMAGVVLSNDVVTFLATWELMTVATFVLVLQEHGRTEARKAAYVLLVASQLGTACIVVALLGLAQQAGSLSFDAFRQLGPLSPALRNTLFALALIGFGTKAGLVPLHVWLPLAHPVAPSHVSALMSGVMIKTAVYGLIRCCFELFRDLDASWGLAILSLATVSAFLGVLFALMEHDLKRLLAYHSIENIGIILMGVGAGLWLEASAVPVLGGYALAAALFHTVNHGLFKALLFMGAGSVICATGHRNLEEMGGLLKRMPRTGLTFFIGAMAICALPPLNGFASEWMVYKTLWALSQAADPWAQPLGALVAAVLATVGGLAAACFAKAFGVAFLGLPRSRRAADAVEVGPDMWVPMASLAAGCALLGLVPGLVLPLLARALPACVNDAAPALTDPGAFLALPVPAGPAPYLSPIAILVAIGLVPLGFHLAWRWLGESFDRPRVYGPWSCGYPGDAPAPATGGGHVAMGRAQYTATAFSQPFAFLFRQFFSRRKLLDVHAKKTEYLPERIVVRIRIRSPFDRWIYGPLRLTVLWLSGRVARIQAGSVQLYLGYMLATLVLLLLVAP
ncbi:MAG: hydrogenase 4 subunit B [Candidatus Riflebacteria bacterium]|nr:hydrogenase 4 subunit B [Candidatus Riflebacteria bacterium]